MQTPYIFDIKRYAINDGPGIRVTIFFKGCPLSCLWCHNPESIAPQRQKLYSVERCIRCGACIAACPSQALRLVATGITTATSRCKLDGACAAVCPTRAMEISGQHYSLDELLTIIERERHLFDQSGGGVTFSGGEPLLHADYLGQLLQLCGQRDLHRTIDTCGYVRTADLLNAAQQTELFLYDFKFYDAERHKRFTGVDNGLILSNLRALAASGADIRMRIPVISGVNADSDNMEQTAAFIAGLEGEKKTVNLLPYHDTARHKHDKLGTLYSAATMAEPRTEELNHISNLFKNHGLTTIIGG